MTEKSPKIISLFNHKGGVSKTTTTFHLGWMLAELGHKVLLVDTDPQCNLTGLVLGEENYQTFYEDHPSRNIYEALRPAFESQPKMLEPVECEPVSGHDNLLLLPGHVNLSEYDVQLGIAQDLSSSIQALKNLPGALYYLINETAKKYDSDYVLIDMNPGLGSINQNLLMISHYFLLPTKPDYFNVMAIDSLVRILPRWIEWAKRFNQIEVLQDSVYPFPILNLEFLGYVVQNFRLHRKKASRGFRSFIDQIKEKIFDKLLPALEKYGVRVRINSSEEDEFCLGEISDFNSLITVSQNTRTPIFNITEEELKTIVHFGKVAQTDMSTVSHFRKLFELMAKKTVEITENAEHPVAV